MRVTMKVLCLFIMVLGIVLGGLVSRAWAITSCTISTAGGVNFGTYNVLNATPLDSTGSLSFNCSNVNSGDTITIDLDKGSAASFTPRTLVGGGTALAYNLYLDAPRTTIWGDGSGGTAHYGPVTPADGTNVTVPVYGQIPSNQNVTAGSYGDTIGVTINF
jgi:spore coat protein U-like protein